MIQNRKIFIAALTALTAPLFMSASGASAQGQCISATARQSVEECSEQIQPRQVRAGTRAPSSVGPDPNAQSEQQQTPGYIEDRMARARGDEGEFQARQRELVEQEVTLLRRLSRNTRSTDPRRPEILLRLASTLFEYQTALNTDVQNLMDPIFVACTEEPNPEQCQQLRRRQQATQEQLNEARRDTIRAYYQLMTDHPDYARMDEVLFSLAYGLDEINEHDQARQVYRRLIEEHPTSRFVPSAYLSFGEYFFEVGEMGNALQFYNKVIEFPPERNSVYGYALYKSAWAHYNNEDFQRSLRAFVQVIEFATSGEGNANLAAKARRELVMPYSHAGNPNQALRFFRRYAEDDEQALSMLERLAEQYYDTGRWDETISVYHALMNEQPESEHLCKWQSKITNATISKNQDREAHVRELGRLRDIQEAFVANENNPPAARNECKAETATVLLWQAVGLHREAVGVDEENPGTNDRATMEAAAAIYRLILDSYPDLDELEFPSISADDRPTRYRISYYSAELLWKMEDWERCGPAFDDVVTLNPQGEYTSDAAYAAVLCYNRLYQSQYQATEGETRSGGDGEGGEEEQSFEPRELTRTEAGMVRAFNRYLCFVEEADEVVTVKFRRARIYYIANHYEEAALAFRDIAMNHPDADNAEAAANLYLDSLNMLGTEVGNGNQACLTEMEQSITPLDERYCQGARADDHPDLCGVLQTLDCQLKRKRAETFEQNEEFLNAARMYRDLYVQCQSAEEHPEELLWNAALNLEAANLVGRAINVRKALVQRHGDTDLAKRSVYLIGANYQSLAAYERAAEYYERFARENPGMDGSDCSEEDRTAGLCANAVNALMNATLFQMGLGNTEQAIEDAELFAENYGRSRPRQTAQVNFSIGAIYERTENWERVIHYYRRFLTQFRRTAAPHQVIMANTAIGRAMWRTDEQSSAARYFRAAATAWRNNAARRILGFEDASQEERIQWVKQAIDGTCESLFYLAEYKFQEVQALRFPSYSGAATLERVNRWASGEFTQWVQRKLRAIQAAMTEYNKIIEVKVEIEGTGELDSPPWQIAAASRIGEMFDEFQQSFRSAPIPTMIDRDEELYGIYVTALDTQSEPFLREAVDKYQFCLTTATNVRWFNEWSRRCEEQLHRINPREYPTSAELRGDPAYVNRPASRPGIEELGGGADAEEDAAGGES